MDGEEYLIAGSPALLRGLYEAFVDDPDATVMSIRGDPAAPNRLVVRLDPRRAAGLSNALGPSVLIEANHLIPPIDEP